MTVTVDVSALKITFRGEIILPTDDSYETARRLHILLFNRYPALILRPVDADDVATAVLFAKDTGLKLAIRGGGHSGAGYSVVDDGIVIDLCAMKTISVDPEAQIVHVQGGAKAGEVIAATIPHGLIVPFGDSQDVGVGGITTGGGVGWLTRKFGMTIDSLQGAEIVTADGRKLHLSETENADLFWAIRGGGGNFGIVTEFVFKAHPLGTVLGGVIFVPATRDTIRGVVELSKEAPEELTTITNMMYGVEGIPGLPKELEGKLMMMVEPIWASSDIEAGQRALEPFRQLGSPISDQVHPMKFNEIYAVNGEDPEFYTTISRSYMADALDDAEIDLIIEQLGKLNEWKESSGIAQIRVLGGAMARVPADATAFANRDAQVLVAVASVGFEEANYEKHKAWTLSLFDAISRKSTGPYLNFMDVEGEARIREAYPNATYQRLAEIKRKYDPDNLFQQNQNIVPATV